MRFIYSSHGYDVLARGVDLWYLRGLQPHESPYPDVHTRNGTNSVAFEIVSNANVSKQNTTGSPSTIERHYGFFFALYNWTRTMFVFNTPVLGNVLEIGFRTRPFAVVVCVKRNIIGTRKHTNLWGDLFRVDILIRQPYSRFDYFDYRVKTLYVLRIQCVLKRTINR